MRARRGGEGKKQRDKRDILEAEERIRDVVDRVFRARGAVATQKEKKKNALPSCAASLL